MFDKLKEKVKKVFGRGKTDEEKYEEILKELLEKRSKFLQNGDRKSLKKVKALDKIIQRTNSLLNETKE